MVKIIIEVKGGSVQNVFSDDPHIDVTIYDWDQEFESKNKEIELKQSFVDDIENMQSIY